MDEEPIDEGIDSHVQVHFEEVDTGTTDTS
jgi:hypothetical protein